MSSEASENQLRSPGSSDPPRRAGVGEPRPPVRWDDVSAQTPARRIVVLWREHHRGGADEASERRHEANVEQEDRLNAHAAVVDERPDPERIEDEERGRA